MPSQILKKHQKRITALEKRLAYSFKNPALLLQALIHGSYAFEQGKKVGKDNETMEFLGDAVLDLTVAYVLFQMFPEMKEGELTRLRAA